MTATIAIDAHLANFEQLNGDAPSWVRRLRQQGMARFHDTGFPTTRLEDWKYTNVEPLARIPFRLPAAVRMGEARLPDLDSVRLRVGVELVFVDGRFVPGLSLRPPLSGQASALSLSEALRNGASLEAYLGTCVGPDLQGFAALNTAFIEDGAFVHVPPDTCVTEPIHLLFVSTGSTEPTISHPRNLLVLETGSSATVIETHIGMGSGSYCTNSVSEAILGPHSALVHVKIQREAETAFHIATIDVRQAPGSQLRSHVLSAGGALSRTDINTVLDAEGAQASLDGLYLASGRQHVDHHTSIDHRQPRCTSREVYKGIMDGHSTAVFNGKVFIRPGAQASDASQVNKNLLLSEDAVVDTKPQLEIFADDVKCSHGATIGRLDDAAVFYLRSRGIGEDEARSLLVFAFANDVISRLPVAPVRAQLAGLLAARFQQAVAPEESA